MVSSHSRPIPLWAPLFEPRSTPIRRFIGVFLAYWSSFAIALIGVVQYDHKLSQGDASAAVGMTAAFFKGLFFSLSLPWRAVSLPNDIISFPHSMGLQLEYSVINGVLLCALIAWAWHKWPARWRRRSVVLSAGVLLAVMGFSLHQESKLPRALAVKALNEATDRKQLRTDRTLSLLNTNSHQKLETDNYYKHWHLMRQRMIHSGAKANEAGAILTSARADRSHSAHLGANPFLWIVDVRRTYINGQPLWLLHCLGTESTTTGAPMSSPSHPRSVAIQGYWPYAVLAARGQA